MKKMYKFVFSLVLVLSSFFFIESVYAAADAKVCVYEVKRDVIKNNLHVVIKNDGSAYIAKTEGYPKGELKNWENADLGGFSGKKYFLENNYSCPPYMIINVQTFGKNDVYAADYKSYINIDKSVKGGIICPLFSEGLASGASDEIKKSTKYSFTTPKTCVCETNPDLNSNAKASFTARFTVDSTLIAPNVSVSYTNKANPKLGNWYLTSDINIKGDGGSASLGYKYIEDLASKNNDSCPAYVVYDPTDAVIYATNKAHLTDFKKIYGRIEAPCHEEVKPTSNSNSNSTSNKTSNKRSNSNSNKLSNNAEFMTIDQYKQCGGSKGALITNIPSIIPRITSTLYNTIMVLVPVVLIIMGTIDLMKGIMSQKEDEMKKGRETFIKRIVGAVIIFLIVLIVKIFVGAVSRDGNNSVRIVDCIDCFVSNSCDTMSK